MASPRPGPKTMTRSVLGGRSLGRISRTRSGSGSIEATTRASVNAQTAGSGTITVHGQPPKVSQNALGDGEIVIR